MKAVIAPALALWGLTGAPCDLIAARENHVYRVRTDSGTYALRLHRQGYRTDAELRSELAWMAAIAQGGISVPAPVPCPAGEFLHVVNGVQVDLLTWLPGAPIGQTGMPLDVPDRSGLFHRTGQMMARLHRISDGWTAPKGFIRCAWDRAGLLGNEPLWGRFWEHPDLCAHDRALFADLRHTAGADLARREAGLDYGLIHADMVRENILMDGSHLHLIDFDDGGFGFRLFDLATTLLKSGGEPDYPPLRAALIAGYRSRRALDTGALDLFMVLRAASYVGWIIPRRAEAGAAIRSSRFIDTTRKLAQEYLRA
jgi:Ser/Thr protein kinase RdoA (MazF antagonist)